MSSVDFERKVILMGLIEQDTEAAKDRITNGWSRTAAAAAQPRRCASRSEDDGRTLQCLS